MANEELKEQINLQKELANLLAEQSDAEAKADSTRKDRVKILQEAVKFENDNVDPIPTPAVVPKPTVSLGLK